MPDNQPARVYQTPEMTLVTFFRQRSLYPARSPQEAWQELLSGHFIKPTFFYCEDGGPQLLGKVAEFRVTSVELAYWEPQPNGPG